jgi:hypothetical protein
MTQIPKTNKETTREDINKNDTKSRVYHCLKDSLHDNYNTVFKGIHYVFCPNVWVVEVY